MISPKVSIVIPVYNVKIYLKRAINSIINQTYNNIEIIIVDDGSTDGSSIICDEYKGVDKRIKVYHKENGGLSSARNYGLNHVTGDWIMFLDSDDWLDKECIDDCICRIKENSVECVIFPYIREYENISKPNYILGECDRKICGKYILRKLFGPVYEEINNPQNIDDLNMACGKLYARKIVGNTRFVPAEIIGSAEDLAFNVRVFKKVNTVFYTSKTYYHYNKINFSSITNKYIYNLEETRNNLYQILDDEISFADRDEYIYALRNRKMIGILFLGINIFKNNSGIITKKRMIENVLIRKEKYITQNEKGLKFCNRKWSFFWYLCRTKRVCLLMVLFYVADKIKKRLK